MAQCPVSGKQLPQGDPNAPAQCPVTGQFADGSRPAQVLTTQQQKDGVRYTLIGIPFSTFTRTLAMGLHELGLTFSQISDAAPHSEHVPRQYSPFGKIPVLLLQHGDKTFGMSETASIARFLDAGSRPLLRFAESERIKNQKLEEMISMTGDAVFASIEGGIVKPYLKNNKTEDVTQEALDNLSKTLEILTNACHGPYIYGMAITWADLFLYPILADLSATPFASELVKFDKLQKWLIRMGKRDAAVKTRQGTLEGGASPP
ncbi:hypothetical protein BCR37DRAFT_208817 [Protomyces lactucae-debilis]|uniref:GST C-terminal domain-containing protein n=1 Tax=Protomyces lactucae-debilis TaxID=2754530 RepID=A0A1Y2FQI1_PROLT|nr:uncharacterized protein BCR37DRAFT_208817 [Protomyces lactucae-debilis]ORY86199.1 hypothetical protein BCR37DRAFT_208817 [Protomyces lactucae-debilis]